MEHLALKEISYVQVEDEGLIRWRNGTQTLILNETANFIFCMLQSEASVDEITAGMVEKFDVEEDTARLHIEEFLTFLRDDGLLVLQSDSLGGCHGEKESC